MVAASFVFLLLSTSSVFSSPVPVPNRFNEYYDSLAEYEEGRGYSYQASHLISPPPPNPRSRIKKTPNSVSVSPSPPVVHAPLKIHLDHPLDHPLDDHLNHHLQPPLEAPVHHEGLAPLPQSLHPDHEHGMFADSDLVKASRKKNQDLSDGMETLLPPSHLDSVSQKKKGFMRSKADKASLAVKKVNYGGLQGMQDKAIESIGNSAQHAVNHPIETLAKGAAATGTGILVAASHGALAPLAPSIYGGLTGGVAALKTGVALNEAHTAYKGGDKASLGLNLAKSGTQVFSAVDPTGLSSAIASKGIEAASGAHSVGLFGAAKKIRQDQDVLDAEVAHLPPPPEVDEAEPKPKSRFGRRPKQSLASQDSLADQAFEDQFDDYNQEYMDEEEFKDFTEDDQDYMDEQEE